MRKLNVGKDGNDSSSIEYKEEIHVIFHKSKNQLISNIIITTIIIIIIIIIALLLI